MNQNSIWDYVVGILITVGFIWLLINGEGNGYGCYEKNGIETCYEDPRR